MESLDKIIQFVSSFPPFLIYSFLFIASFMENICPPIPGDTIIAFGAFLAGQKRVSFLNSYLSTIFGSWFGFMVVFGIGWKLEAIKRKLPFFKPEDILKAESWLKRYGYLIILLNRYIPAVRAVISLTAGILRFSPIKVMLTSLIGCASWNLAVMYLGLKIGSNWEEIKIRLSHLLFQYNLAASVVIISIILVLIFLKKRSSK